MAERNIPVTCCRCRVDGNKSVNQVSFTRHEEAAPRWRRGTRRRQQENGSPAAKAQGMCPTHFSFSFISFSFSSSSSAHLIHFKANSCALVTESAICKWHANDLVSQKKIERVEMKQIHKWGAWEVACVRTFFSAGRCVTWKRKSSETRVGRWLDKKKRGHCRWWLSANHIYTASTDGLSCTFFSFFFKKRILPKTD